MSTDDHTSKTTDWPLETYFKLYDLRLEGCRYPYLGRLFDCKSGHAKLICDKHDRIVSNCGYDVYIQGREAALELTLDHSCFLHLTLAGLCTVDQIVRFASTGVPYVRNLGNKRRFKLIEQLKGLGLIETEFKIPHPMNLPNPLDWQLCLEYWGHKCAACGVQASGIHDLQQDHWVPRSLDICPGTIVTNIIPLCISCNTIKLNHDGYHWLVERFGKARADQVMRKILDYFDWWREQGRE